MKPRVRVRKYLCSFLFMLLISQLLVPGGALVAAPGDVVRCSVSSGGVEGNGHSSRCKLSSDGRYVAFESEANNLVPGDGNNTWDVFRKDLQTGAIVRCSTDSSGGEGNGSSYTLSISSDGRYVAFMSQATNLVSPATSNVGNVFRKDLQTGTTVLCSTSSAGVEGNAFSGSPSISSDGRYVAFESLATNLVPGDTNGQRDVFRKDLQTGAIVRCSTDSLWQEGNGLSSGSFISSDGTHVAFYSYASNLVTGDTNGTSDVFRKDAQTGAVTRCSTDSAGGQANNSSITPSLSPDGRYVVFASTATNLVSGDNNAMDDIFRKDIQTGAIVRCSTSSGGGEADANSSAPSINADERYVTFLSAATNLVSGDTNGEQDVFRKDIQTGATVRCSTSSAGTQGNGESDNPSISGDGKYVLFNSLATNLVGGDGNGKSDVFRKELAPPPPAITSIAPDKGEAGTEVTIAGTDFGDSQGSSYVSFGSVQATQYLSWSDTQIKVKVPAEVSGTVGVTVTTGGGTSNAVEFTLKEVPQPQAPAITSIAPDKGEAGTEVTIAGTDFGDTRGSSYVSFGSVQATQYLSWSDTQIKVKVPAGVFGTVEVTVTTSAGTSNAVEFSNTTTFYFAEGYTGEGFEEWLCLGQPVDAPLDVEVTYLFTDGSTQVENYTVPALSRLTIFVNDTVGEGKEVSLKCEADYPFVAERPMYFNYGGAWSGGHDVVGATAPSDTWYFAEGYTGPGFEEWVCVLNPGDAPADLTFRFQTQEEGEKTVEDLSVPAHSRRSFKANDLLGGGAYQTSLKVESTQPVVAERPMYFNYSGTGGWNWTGGHCVMGVPELASDYFFAEGYTGSGFEEWITIQNPGEDPISIEATYMMGTGAVKEEIYDIPAKSRSTIYVPDVVGADQEVSARLTSPSPFLAERPMYFNYMGTGGWGWTGGHCVIGTPAAAREWFFAEGYTGSGFEEWLCIQNPTGDDASVTITYYPSEGTPIVKEPITVAANSRHTVFVNAHAGADLQISAEVVSTKPVICERPIYFDYKGWTGGHDVVGYAP
ncbi:MAG: hypothetical protein HPY75_01120 [Actinobacteria bacterium]|nr:hypothetical protein [Actinomycetota bacterium]